MLTKLKPDLGKKVIEPPKTKFTYIRKKSKELYYGKIKNINTVAVKMTAII